MIFNRLGKSGLDVSAVGLGCEHLEGKDMQTVDRVVKAAVDCRMNIFDVFMSEPNVRSNIGRALEGCREKVILQGHIGSAYVDGQYHRTRDIKLAEQFFNDFMIRLGTDYVDIGMIHFVDTAEDLHQILDSDIIKYAVKLKKQGRIRAVGLSSHAPAVALEAVKTGLIDVLMFSINPAFDLLPQDTDIDALFAEDTYKDDTLLGIDPVRTELYTTCEQLGVGITVMKGLASGILLNGGISPLGRPMTVHQCIHYALTRPAVSSVLVGCKTPEEVFEAASYAEKSDEDRDYTAVLSKSHRYTNTGQCMYCNHCLPCPAKIDIAAVHKYLDMTAITGGTIAPSLAEHYHALGSTAENCIECGSCEDNCPFGVSVIENMRKARSIFS